MDQTQRGEPDAARPVAVAVKRTGGFAGLTRQWRAEPPPAQAPEWIALITRCPWDAAPPEPTEDSPRGADRFTWRIEARCDEDEHEAELPDDEVVGAWRELVDAVRAWSRETER
jgi:hypothetical protein